jgi:hypothetical protein
MNTRNLLKRNNDFTGKLLNKKIVQERVRRSTLKLRETKNYEQIEAYSYEEAHYFFVFNSNKNLAKNMFHRSAVFATRNTKLYVKLGISTKHKCQQGENMDTSLQVIFARGFRIGQT